MYVYVYNTYVICIHNIYVCVYNTYMICIYTYRPSAFGFSVYMHINVYICQCLGLRVFKV